MFQFIINCFYCTDIIAYFFHRPMWLRRIIIHKEETQINLIGAHFPVTKCQMNFGINCVLSTSDHCVYCILYTMYTLFAVQLYYFSFISYVLVCISISLGMNVRVCSKYYMINSVCIFAHEKKKLILEYILLNIWELSSLRYRRPVHHFCWTR